jgi:hypothetical protein
MRQDCPKHLKRTNTNNVLVGEITPEELCFFFPNLKIFYRGVQKTYMLTACSSQMVSYRKKQ